MQLRLRIVHVDGCYSLVESNRTIEDSKDSVVQTSFYAWRDEAAKEKALLDLITFAKGVQQGWELARRSLGTVHLTTMVEEFQQAKETTDKTLNLHDGTLDAFIRDYCQNNGIECDGGVFSLYFCITENGKDKLDFSEREASLIIDQAAIAYELYETKAD